MTKFNLVGVAAALLATLSSTSAADCSYLTQNLLTSEGCPSKCTKPASCIMYSPTQINKCTRSDAAGACLTDDTFVAPDGSSCSMTYQCLNELEVDLPGNGVMIPTWWLNTKFNAAEKRTTVYATQIQSVSFSDQAQSVQLAAGPTTTPKGDVQNLILDPNFIKQQTTILQFVAMHINLRDYLANITFPPQWLNVYLINANLDKVPAQLGTLKLTRLDLSKNYISVLPTDSQLLKGLQTLAMLNLAENNLTDFPWTIPTLTNLSLSGNPFTTIPPAVFNMTSLQSLYMKGCKLMDVKLTNQQIGFLNNLNPFAVDATTSKCDAGYGPQQVAGASFCVEGAANPSTESSSSSHTGLIVGICVAAVVVIAAIAFFIVRRNKIEANRYKSTTGKTAGTIDSDLTEGMLDNTTGSGIWNDPDLLAVRLDYKDIELVKLLSRGGFGEVWLGKYMGEKVAVKRLLSDKKTMSDASAFAEEVKVMARLDHPKIVRFIGVAWTNALTIQAVNEYMDCGDLKSLLESNRASSLTWANLKLQLSIDIADALVYMHTLNPKLIHRDLKSRNVLIDATSGAKLSDFGISRNRSFEETMTAGVGTARWIAPEVILGGHYTEAADIFSYGVVLSEIDTCQSPYYDAMNTNGTKMQDVTILQLVSAGKLTPSFSAFCPASVVALAKACLSFDPAERPSAIHVAYELRTILREEFS